MNTKLTTPVLYLIFNRLDTVKQTFEAIRQAEPPRLYIGADGPRDNKLGEEEKVKEVRDFVLSNIDWDCEVKTLFRDKNLGCGLAVSQAISWFFENEEMGIILEDDCFPSQSFFWYCEELLYKYKDDDRIGMISGRNSLGIYNQLNASYCFTTGGGIWGWASWKRVAKNFDIFSKIYDLDELYTILINSTCDKIESRHITNVLKKRKNDIWDYQWGTYLKVNSMLAITPKLNLTRNVGFNAEATHTTGITADIDNFEISLPLEHPEFIYADRIFTQQLAKSYYKKSLLLKILKKLNILK